jgi:hypothetical protein
LSFGCASDVLGLVEEALLDLEPMPMSDMEGRSNVCCEAPILVRARL